MFRDWRSDIIEGELAARVLVDFGSDTVADDWHHRISAKKNHYVGDEAA